MATRDLAKEISAAQAEVNALQQRLSENEQAIAAVKIQSPPSTDIEAEERQALALYARSSALQRVQAALQVELGSAQQKLNSLKNLQREEDLRKLQAAHAEAKSEAVDALWEVYAKARAWQTAADELGKFTELGNSTLYPFGVLRHVGNLLQGIPESGAKLAGGPQGDFVTRVESK